MEDCECNCENENPRDRRKRLANNRQKVYYQNHCEDIKKKFQEQRNELKQLKQQIVVLEEQVVEPAPFIAPPAPVVKGRGRPKKQVFTLDVMKAKIALVSKESSLKTYNVGLDTMFRELGNDFSVFIKDFDNVKKTMESAKKIRGKGVYGLSNVVTFSQISLIALNPKNNFGMEYDKVLFDKYEQWYSVVKLQYDIFLANKKKTEVMPYPEYKQKIIDKFGVGSKQALIVEIYEEFTCRDDVASCLIVGKKSDITEDKGNYIIVPRKAVECCIFVIQSYKTAKSRGTNTYTVSTKLNKIIRKYIIDNKLTDKLFPDNFKNGLSPVVKAMSVKIGLKTGGTNLLRHMIVATLLNNPDITPEQRVGLAKNMGHSVFMQEYYNRVIKN